jgi:plasmid stabilization system protein ParE
VKLSVLPSARTDIRNQIEYYLELDLPHVADRFQLALNSSIRAAYNAHTRARREGTLIIRRSAVFVLGL